MGVASMKSAPVPRDGRRPTPRPLPASRRRGATAERGVLQDNAPEGRITFSEKFACPVSGFTIAEIEPRLFSFNAPQGACPGCDGLGEKQLFDPELIVPNEALVDQEGRGRALGALQPAHRLITCRCSAASPREFGFSLETPWKDLPEEIHDIILNGTKGRPVTLRFIDGRKSYEVKKPFDGVIGNLNRRMLQTESAWMREELSKYQSAAPCEICHGARLRPEPLAVKIAGEHISQATARSVRHALAWFSTLDGEAHPDPERDRPRDPQGDQRAARLPQQCRARLSRPQPHLGHALGRREPAHPPRQPDRLGPVGRALRARRAARSASTSATMSGCSSRSSGLRDLGNTVLVVEHDEDAIRHADYVIDMGPGAGVHGGAGRLPRHARRRARLRDQPDRRLSHRPPRGPDPGQAPQGHGQEADRSTAPPPTISRTSPPRSRSAPSAASPASRARASRASPSTRSTPPPRAS